MSVPVSRVPSLALAATPPPRLSGTVHSLKHGEWLGLVHLFVYGVSLDRVLRG